ncbi:50S ribosomal protein L9 [Thermophagus xiamenensis]|uniref:Large ribosomal subunit protein bL9 n=1 Tax=Thermophagus xiamenensis TaxID=385682 RepID=A0A1I2BZD0_9BACT|nr:50S ribosomal protein L9 [Thermophagus xiamenensis]SFE61335.1 large subunit ribosomal protein L9 [Thermophagus xiamenensis]
MEVILKEDVPNLGHKNDIVTVRPGYGRNYLIPKGIAILATESAKKVLAENKKQQAHKEEKIRNEALELAKKLEGTKVTIGAKTSSTGKIFGSVNNIQIAEALTEKGFSVERKNISIVDDSVKEVGNYKAEIKLHKDVKVEIDFEVVSE